MLDTAARTYLGFVHDSASYWFWPVLAFAAALAVKGFFLGISRWRLARRLEDLPTSRARSAAQGLTELLGRADFLPEHVMHAPLTRKPSVWWSYRIQCVRDSSVEDWRLWLATVLFQKVLDFFESFPVQESGKSEQPFLLHDDTGSCIVFPKDSEVVFGRREIWYGDDERPPAPAMGKLGVASNYRYEEQRIEPQDLIYVIGHFRTSSAVELPWEEEMETANLLRQWQQDYDGLLAKHDVNRDGRIDATEWSLVRRAARREIRKQRAARLLGVTPHRILNGRDGHGMLIVVLNEAKLLFRLRCAAAGWLLLFFGLGAISLMTAAMRTGV